MASISLGNQTFIGTQQLYDRNGHRVSYSATWQKRKSHTAREQRIAILQGFTMVATFDLADGATQAWFSTAAILFSGATVQDIHDDDRIEYSQGYNRGIDWRDMAATTDD